MKWVDPGAGEDVITLSKFVPWIVQVVDAQSKEPLQSFTVMNRLATNLNTSFGPSTGRQGEALAGYFTENTIRPRVLTIEAPGYEMLRVPITPELGGTNKFELHRKPVATPP